MIIGLGVLLLVNRMHISDKKLLGLGLIFYFCSEIVTFFVHNSNKMSGIMGILAGLCKIVFGSGGGRTLGGFTYLLIGVFLQRYFSDINQKKWLYILLLTQIISVCVPSVAIFLRIPRVMSIVGFFLKLNLKPRLLYKKLRNISIIVYFTHMIVLFLWSFMISGINSSGINVFCPVLVSSLIIAILIDRSACMNSKICKEIF